MKKHISQICLCLTMVTTVFAQETLKKAKAVKATTSVASKVQSGAVGVKQVDAQKVLADMQKRFAKNREQLSGLKADFAKKREELQKNVLQAKKDSGAKVVNVNSAKKTTASKSPKTMVKKA